MLDVTNAIINAAIQASFFVPLLMWLHWIVMQDQRNHDAIQEQPVSAPQESAPTPTPKAAIACTVEPMVEVLTITDEEIEDIEVEAAIAREASLACLTVKELKAMAKERGIKGYSKWSKAQLIGELI